MDAEIKPIAGFPDYGVDNQGNIYNKEMNKVYIENINKKYRTIRLGKGKKASTKMVKHIVAEAFVSKPSDFHTKVVHKSNNTHDDRAENLEWVVGFSDKTYNVLVGEKFNKLEVIGVVWYCSLIEKGLSSTTRARLLCQCECGGYITIEKTRLIKGNQKSCGCIMREVASQPLNKNGEEKKFLAQVAEKAKQLESYGWKIKGEYKNLLTPTTLICANGHETTLKIHNWNRRSEERRSVCGECEKKKKATNLLNQLGQLQLDAIAQGYSVSEAGDKSLELICASGHRKVVNPTWEVKDCLDCKYDAMHDKKRDRIEAILNTTGYTIVEYEKDKITYKCMTCNELHQVVGLSIQNLVRDGRVTCQKCRVAKSITSAGYKLIDEYTGAQVHMDMICPVGHLTSATWGSWNSGNRCLVCHNSKFGNVVQVFLDEVKEEGYTLLDEYVSRRGDIPCRCPQGHEWKLSRHHWKRGVRCKYCNTGGGFSFEKPGLLYYLRVNSQSGNLYKIGITNNSVKSRYRAESANFDIVSEIWYEIGEDAYNEEQRILADYKEYKYTGEKVLTSGGNTELFVTDVLGLDSKVETPASA